MISKLSVGKRLNWWLHPLPPQPTLAMTLLWECASAGSQSLWGPGKSSSSGQPLQRTALQQDRLRAQGGCHRLRAPRGNSPHRACARWQPILAAWMWAPAPAGARQGSPSRSAWREPDRGLCYSRSTAVFLDRGQTPQSSEMAKGPVGLETKQNLPIRRVGAMQEIFVISHHLRKGLPQFSKWFCFLK